MSAPALIVIQARMGSTRLPGKVLAPIAGRPLLALQVERVRRLGLPITMATSDLAHDDPIAALAGQLGVSCVRGSEQDVLSRFMLALAAHPVDRVVRLTADCPFTDPAVVRLALDEQERTRADHVGNGILRTWPNGLDVEVVSAAALATAAAEAPPGRAREHVTPYLYRRPDRFRLGSVRWNRCLSWVRWTIDTADDLAEARALAQALLDPAAASTDDLLRAAGPPLPPPHGVCLRPVMIDDAPFLLGLRNDPVVIAASGTARAVTAEEHAAWLAQRVGDPAVRLLLVHAWDDDRHRPGPAVGQVRVDVAGGASEGVGVVSLALHPQERGAGVGVRSLLALLDLVREDAQLDILEAHIRPDNAPSLRAFATAGFELSESHIGPDGTPLRRLRWHR